MNYQQFDGDNDLLGQLMEMGFSEKAAQKVINRNPVLPLQELVDQILNQSEDHDEINQEPPANQQQNQNSAIIVFSELENISNSNKSIEKKGNDKSLKQGSEYSLRLQQEIKQNKSVQQEQKIEVIHSIPENLCKVCYQEAVQWIIFKCGHSFCLRCVLEYHRAKYPLGFKVNEVNCLEQGCKQELSLLSSKMIDQIIPTIHFSLDELCQKCSLPKDQHKNWHCGLSCEKAESLMLAQLEVQPCPRCGVLGTKDVGCNSVNCCRCNYNWCWLCRKEYTPNHYLSTNPLGCPGLGYDRKSEWPSHKICYKRLKACLLYFLATILSVIIYPFFVSYLVFFKLNLIPRALICTSHINNGYLQKIALGFILIALTILFLLISCLAIFPGLLIMLVSKKARSYIFFAT